METQNGSAAARALAFVALVALLWAQPLTRGPLLAADPSPSPRIFRLERWLRDAFEHAPGEDDRAVEEVRSWSSADSETLRIDELSLLQLLQDPQQETFLVSTSARPGSAAAKSRAVIAYTFGELHRLKVLACVATGHAATSAACKGEIRLGDLYPELIALNEAASRDSNFILRRGALLHADTEIFGGAAIVAPAAVSGSLMVQGRDGQQTSSAAAGANWEAAASLLDAVRPAHDPMVLLWYRATGSWMQREGNYHASHVDHGSEMFPNAAEVLFLSGCQHEVYASPRVQALVNSAVLPPGRVLEATTQSAELALAESYFRRAVTNSPGMAEARLRLGHVLLARGKSEDAVRELQTALTSLDDPLLKYFGEMFLGAAEQATKRPVEARAAYTVAEQLYPSSQSAALALSALAVRQGDRASGTTGIDRVFASAGEIGDDRDPWWNYYAVQVRNTDALLKELYRPFRETP